jgi:hypothetical protein
VFDYAQDTEGWTTTTVPTVFSPPDFLIEPDFLVIVSPNNTNAFGYWQSPEGAVILDQGYLYRARFTVATDISDQSRVPQIRLRAKSSNLQEVDYLTIESAGDGGASPTPAGTDYDLYFVPPANDTSIILAFDLLNFNPADAPDALLMLDTVTMERLPLDELSTPTLVRDYSFDLSVDGWTTGGAPVVFTAPLFSQQLSTIQLSALNNTNTFGYWQNGPADVTVVANKLYRGKFEVRTDVTDKSRVPQMRLRFNMANLQASRTLGIESVGDGANSPGTTNTTYDNLYFLPPANCVGEGVIVSFDMLNFSPDDAPTGSLILDRATIEALTPPATP